MTDHHKALCTLAVFGMILWTAAAALGSYVVLRAPSWLGWIMQ